MFGLFKNKPDEPPHPDDECEVLKRHNVYVVRHIKSGTYFRITSGWVAHVTVFEFQRPKGSITTFPKGWGV